MGGSECEESVLAAIRSGYRMIDTAEAYRNEEAVGSAIVKSGIPREELFLVTKVNFRSYENTRETVEASLNKLKTSYSTLFCCTGPLAITMRHGVNWKRCTTKEKSGRSAFPTLIRAV